ncbi:MAG TPA: chemotaxis protein CheW [Pyrinomonadaceae bacterium]|jgi:chemotaxis signal transduction protein|nr:chemotaxis protein CheW [Pyrinomonadaceae bacterium]
MRESDTNDARGGGEMFVLRAGRRLFAVPAEEVEATAAGLVPAPLPFAPPSVLGVVSVRGRVHTVLDPLRLVRADEKRADASVSRDADVSAPRATNEAADGNDAAGADGAPDQTSVTTPRLFVAIRGDEQLALACDAAGDSIRVARERVTPHADALSPALGTFEHEGSLVTLLDTSRLFEAAMQGTDRRRKRS